MITKEDVRFDQYCDYRIDENSIVLSPHRLLRPYIANYTFTCPRTMDRGQMVLPTVSSTLVCAIESSGSITNGLRGVNTKPTVIGSYARQFDFMFLIEFHTAGLYPFLSIDQDQVVNKVFSFEELSNSLNRQITEAYDASNDICMLRDKLDDLFLSRLGRIEINSTVRHAIKKVLACRGRIQVKDLAGEVYYSEKQLNRLFLKYAGTNAKTFTRIVRMKNAVHLLGSSMDMQNIFEQSGHYDYAHFIHDFKDIYGITPKEYTSKMSLFYNDPTKLQTV